MRVFAIYALVVLAGLQLYWADDPTALPSAIPSTIPSVIPSQIPSETPTTTPSIIPSAEPSVIPTAIPSAPTANPTLSPTETPTRSPTRNPTCRPTRNPTNRPTHKPSGQPTFTPTAVPTREHTDEDPVLLSYTLDMSVGKLVLTFDKLISARTMDVTGITLISEPYDDTIGTNYAPAFTLTSTYNDLQAQGNSTSLLLYLTADDIAAILLTPPVARAKDTTYLAIVREAVLSPFGHANKEVVRAEAIQPAVFVGDKFPPYVTGFSLFMDTGIMWLKFTEPVDVTTFTLVGLTLQSRAYLGDGTNDPVVEAQVQDLVDQGSSVVQVLDRQRTLHVQLGEYNLNRIKSRLGLAVTLPSSYISAWKPFINDTSGNPVSLIGFDKLHALRATHYLPDLEPPTLRYWDFNRNTGTVWLTFSETVYREFFNYSKVLFVSGSTLSGDPVQTFRVDNPTNLTQRTTNEETITFTLNAQQFDELKARAALMTSPTLNSFLVLEFYTVVDTSEAQNMYQGTDATPEHPRAVRRFYHDVTVPQLLSFVLDMDRRLVRLLFSETVNITTVRIGELALQAESNVGVGTELLPLSDTLATLVTTVDSPELVLSLSTTAFARIKAMQHLAKSAATTFVSLSRDFVRDQAGNATHPGNRVEAVPRSAARRASRLVPDRSPPSLDSWHIDLTLNRLVLTFSEPVDTTSLRSDLITLWSDPRVIPSTVAVALSEGTIVVDVDINVVTLQLSEQDAKRLRLLGDSDLCISEETCFLSAPQGFVNGTAAQGNTSQVVRPPIAEVSLFPATSFVVDTVPPALRNYSIDLTQGIMRFVFDEPVVPRLLNASALALHYRNGSDVRELQLSDFAAPTEADVSAAVDIKLTQYDLIRLQELAPLATSLSTANLTVDGTFMSDVAGNAVTLPAEYPDGLLPPYEFVEDLTPPRLVAANLALGVGSANLTLYFSELVDVDMIKQRSIFLVSSSGVTVSLERAALLSAAVPSQEVEYSLAPIAASLAAAGLATSQATTHVYIAGAGTMVDVAPAQNALRSMSVTAAIRDGPSITSFRLDLTAATILLELSYPALIASVDPTKITLYSGDLSKFYRLKSMNGYELDVRGPFVRIHLSATDHAALRSTFTISARSDVLLQAGVTALLDDTGKQLSAAATLVCSVFVPDRSPLRVVSYDLDLAVGTLRLYFNKEAETSTADFTDTLALHSSALSDGSGTSVVLSNLTVIDEPDIFGYVMPNVTTLFLSLSNGAPLTTREQILQAYPLASALGSTQLSVRKGMIYDLARPRNPVPGIPAVTGGAHLQATTLVEDKTPPVFVAFDVDLNTRLLSLHFSEAVNVNTVSVDKITILQSPTVTTAPQYQLTTTSEVVSVAPGRTVDVQLSEKDVNAMMALAPQLLFTASNTHISMKQGAVYDLATPANPSAVAYYRYGVLARTFVPDTTPPQMRWFNMSVQSGNLVFHFDELVVCSEVDPHQLVLQATQFNGQLKRVYRVSNASRVDCSFGPKYDNYVYVTLDPDDLFALKAFTGFAKTMDNTYLRLLPGFVKDVFGNGNEEMLDGFAQQPSRFIPDTTSPQLLSFLVNRQRQMSLFFDEPVDHRTNVVREYYLQDDYSAPTQSFPLILSTIYRADVLRARLDLDISKDSKFIDSVQSNVLVKQSHTFLRVSSAAIQDFSGNALLKRPRANSLQLGPAVIAWDLDMNTGVVELTFNEAVDPTFSLVGFTVQDRYDNDANNLAFTTSTAMTVLAGSTLSVRLNHRDLNALKTTGLGAGVIATRFNITDGPGTTPSLYLTAEYGLTKSTNAGDLEPYMDAVELRTTNAVRVRRLRKDITPPQCQSFSVDLNTGLLLLTFDEPTDPSSLQLSLLVLSSSVTGHFVQLSDSDRLVSLVNATQLMVNLSRTDLNSIKREIATSVSLSVLDSLVMYAGAVTDLRGNAFIGNDADHPILVDQFIRDNTAPRLVSWILDRTALKLRLEFSEYVRSDFVRPDRLVLLSADDYATAPVRLRLTNYSKVYQGDPLSNEVLVDLELYRQDGFALQAIASQGLGTLVANTYLAITELRDLFGNVQTAVQVVQAEAVTADTRPLYLQAFDWRYDVGDTYVTVTMYFSKVVDVDTFTCADLQFRSAANHYASDVISLAATDCTLQPGQVDSHIIQFAVAHSLFSATTIGDSVDTTFAGVPVEGATQDLSGNKLAFIRSDRFLREGPQLLRYQLDIPAGVITFDFNKPLDRSTSFNASELGFFSTITQRSYYLRSPSTGGMLQLQALSGLAVDDTNNTIGALQLDAFDLTKLKLLDIAPAKLYALVAEDAALTDYSGVGLAPLTRWRKLAASAVTRDDDAPRITRLALSSSNDTITIEFDEPIRLETVNVTHFCLQGTADLRVRPTRFYCLTTTLPSVDVSTLTLNLSKADAAAIKLIPGLGNSTDTTFLSFEFYTAADMAGNQLASVPTQAARQFDAVDTDDVLPVLDAFVMDVSNPERTLLYLIFSEPVNADAINMTAITIQNRFASRDGVRYRLTGGTVVATNLFTVTVALLPTDVTAMKLIPELMRTKQTTYLVVDAGMTTDLVGNPLIAYLDGAALSCQSFVRDLSPPIILTSTFNANDGTLTFLFNEPISLATVDVTALTVQLPVSVGSLSLIGFGNTRAKYTLTSLSTVRDADTLSATLVIQVSQSDLDELKNRFPLLSSRADTWFSYTPLFVEDTSGNAIVRVLATSPTQVTTFIQDTTFPAVISYGLDMNARLVTLRFSEAIQATTVNLSQLVMQNIETRRFGTSVVLDESTYTVGTGAASNLLTVHIGNKTIARMKAQNIGATEFQSFLSWTDSFVADNAGNYLGPLWDGSVFGFTPRKPDVLQLDTMPPQLQRWYLHRDAKAKTITAHLFFDEPVLLHNVSDLAVSYARRDGRTGRLTESGTVPMGLSHPLALFPATVTYAEDNLRVVITLSNYCTSHDEVAQTDACLTSPWPTQNLFAFLNRTEDARYGYFLAPGAEVVEDFAAVPNLSRAVQERQAIPEGGPDCRPCSGGSRYMVRNCTATSDRVCRSCSSCADGFYMQAPCSGYQDTACAVCSTCGYGSYIRTPCAAKADTVCAACNSCGRLQYAARSCERGLDVICNSCESCSFADPAVQEACESDKAYFPWQRANCCKGPKGDKVPCSSLDRVEILQASIDGRHHWDFASTAPPIDTVRNPGIRFPRGY